MKQKDTKRSLGFTLIELMVVMSVIGLISSMILVTFKETRAKARDARRIQDLHNIQIALELYYAEHGYYPGQDDIPTTSVDGDYWDILGDKLSPYLPVMAKDPVNVGRDFAGYPIRADEFYYYYYSPCFPCEIANAGSPYPGHYDLVTRFESKNHALRCTVKKYKNHEDINPENNWVWCPEGDGNSMGNIYSANIP